MISLSSESFVYNGSRQVPNVTVAYGGLAMTEGTDFSVSLPTSATNAGEYSVTVAGRGDLYRGSASKTFTIAPKPLDMGMLSALSDVEYNGKPQTPNVVLVDGATLKVSTDYKVEYANNVDAGQARVSIEGQGNYTGNLNTHFAINPCTVRFGWEYDQKAFKAGERFVPTASVANRADGQTDADLNVAAYDEIRVSESGGTTEVTDPDAPNLIRVASLGGGKAANYTLDPNEPTTSHAWHIVKGTNEASVVAQGWTYGDAITPHQVLALEGAQDAQFLYSQTQNGAYTAEKPSNAGTYWVKARIPETAHYTSFDTAPASFEVAKAVLKVQANDASITFGEAPAVAGLAFSGFVNGDAEQTLDSKPRALTSYQRYWPVGTYDIYPENTHPRNYVLERENGWLTVNKANIAQASIAALADTTYTGSALTPKPVLKLGSYVLEEGDDYKLAYRENTAPGTAYIDITALDGGNFSGSTETAFTIVQPIVSILGATVTGIANKTYTGKAQTQSPVVKVDGKTLKANTDYKLVYKNNVNVGTAIITITGIGNYKDSVSRTFKIAHGWKRLYGNNALQTMEKITKEYGASKTAIVTTNAVAAQGADAGYKDALASAALAGGFGAPMLTTSKGGLSDLTKSELQRMGVTTVYIVGTANEVAKKVETQIKALPKVATVKRIGDATASARAISCAKLTKGRSDTVIIATQNNFKDALSISSYAYATKSPILYAEANKKLSSATVNYIKQAKFKKAIIVGGPVALPKNIEDQLKGAGIAAGSITRLAGSNQYATSRVIAEWALGKLKNGSGGGSGYYQYASIKFQPAFQLSANKLGVARADDNKIGWKDALAGAALCGKNKSILLLCDDNVKAFNVYGVHAENVVRANGTSIAFGYVFGGPLAVSENAMSRLEAAASAGGSGLGAQSLGAVVVQNAPSTDSADVQDAVGADGGAAASPQRNTLAL